MTIRNLDALFDPKSVVLVGASNQGVGAVLASNLLNFDGDVAFVNPRHREVAGHKCHASVASVPDHPDLAVIATPGPSIPALISELGSRGTRACTIITSGIDVKTRESCLAAAKPFCMRLLGPNSIGLLLPGPALNASFAHRPAPSGDLALISQSGALVTALIDWAADRAIGFSHVVSMGDMADVDFGDVLDYLAADPSARAILLYAEQITHAPKFMSAARRAARVKPVIVLKPGRHAGSASAAKSHTGALSGSDAVYEAAFRRAGVLRVNTLEEMFSAAEILHSAPSVKGKRLAILTNGGGVGVLAADKLIDLGGELAPISTQTSAMLNSVLPANWSQGNPVDIIGDAPPSRYEAALKILLNDPTTDGILVLNCPTALASGASTAAAVIDAINAQKSLHLPLKAVLTSWLGESAAWEARKLFEKANIPSFSMPDDAIAAFMQLASYTACQKQIMETPPALPADLEVDPSIASSIIAGTIASGRSLMTEAEAKDVLRAYKIPVAETITAKTPDGAAAAATQILTDSKACVLKIVSQDISHKSDVGGVRLGLRTPEEVREAAWSILAEVKRKARGARINGFAVEPMIERKNATELIIGATEDRTFGPVILFGAGGTSVEVVDDTSLALPPLNMNLAHELIGRTRISRILAGFRNQPEAAVGQIAQILVQVSSLITNHSEIRDLDINPLLTDQHGCIALDARINVWDNAAEARTPFAVRPFPIKWQRNVEIPQLGKLLLRPVRPEDEPQFATFFTKVTDEDVRLRFFAPTKNRSHEFIARLTQIDYAREVAFVALSETSGDLLGVARLVADPDYKTAEFAILVRSDVEQRGIGWQLMQLLLAYAKEEGLVQINGNILAENAAMLSMCRKLGFAITTPAGDATIRQATFGLNRPTELAAAE